MVGGPDPVRLPAAGVSPWGRWPRYHAQDASSDRPGHHAGPGEEPDADDGDPDHGELWHDRAKDSTWRHSSASIRDREEPGHLNRQA